jgi:ribosome-binding factor A
MKQQQKKNTHRIEKVNSHIQQVLGPILHEALMGEKGLVTVSKVETSRDMKWAKIWISILGLGADDEKILNHIKSHIYEIQGQLNDNFTTKIVPRLQFFLDTSPRHAQHIDELIKKVHDENKS